MCGISNIKTALGYGVEKLTEFGTKDPKLCAELLLSEVCNISRHALYVNFNNNLTNDQVNKYKSFIDRRSKNEPIQYILGYAYFRGLKFNVGKGVLIPRPETEMFVEHVLANMNNQALNVLEIGAGSGCISCSIATENKNSNITCVEISKDAYSYAKHNIKNLNLSNQIKIINDDFQNYIPEQKFDYIISNPPYIPPDVFRALDDEVKNYEPSIALLSKKNGMDCFYKIVDYALKYLNPKGHIAFELFEDSLNDAKHYLEMCKFKKVKLYKDLAGIPRFIIASI